MADKSINSKHWTCEELRQLPYDEWHRYELIKGELYVWDHPHYNHQRVVVNVAFALTLWSEIADTTEVVTSPGIIFAEDECVAPDLIWLSKNRILPALDENGHLHLAPELIVEVLEAGEKCNHYDRHIKREVYSQRGVKEYWVVNWRERWLEVYRRKANAGLELLQTLYEPDMLESPLLAGFQCQVKKIFEDVITL